LAKSISLFGLHDLKAEKTTQLIITWCLKKQLNGINDTSNECKQV